MDVWQRDHLTIHFQKTKSSEAQIYTVAMRVTKDAYAQLYKISGNNGIYIEPRTEDGRGHDGRFHTIWLPKLPLSEVRALQAMQTCPSSIIRVSHRYGLKVSTADAEQVHAKVHPDEPFLAGASKMSYRVGPFPWGTTKKAIQQLFQQWGWAAKAINTIAKAQDSSGLMWLVQANGPPASLVFQLQHGDVVIHQDSQVTRDTWRPPPAQASIRELREKPAEMEFDPWAASAKLLKRNEPMSDAQRASIEAKVEQRVVRKIQDQQLDADMEQSWEPRVAQLEQQIATLQSRSSIVENKVDMLHQQVDAQASKFEKALDNKLTDQMARIEALMAKRSRAHE